MIAYVSFIAATMAVGGLMPWILQQARSPWAWQDYKRMFEDALNLRRVQAEYEYTSNNSYTFCPVKPTLGYGELRACLESHCERAHDG
jgi:hypothetical protein